jgi:putative restriction endonuclease
LRGQWSGAQDGLPLCQQKALGEPILERDASSDRKQASVLTAVVLESELGSEYDDSPDSYEFPARYLKHFNHAANEPLIAIIYEPRGESGAGQMAYVALAEVVGDPEPTGRANRAGAALWRVKYRRPAEPFPQIVPREWLGEPVEAWLRPLPRGRQRNVATVGRAVRSLTAEDLERILMLAGVGIPDVAPYPESPIHGESVIATRERADLLVHAFVRAASFRTQVLEAYDYRCAITGLGIGSIAPTKSRRLLDAAHIRPVLDGGPDAVGNGLPMTPTVHRFFDAGLITVAYVDGTPRLKLSSRLEPAMIEVGDRAVALGLRANVPLLAPNKASSWPHPDYLRFHEAQIFRD